MKSTGSLLCLCGFIICSYRLLNTGKKNPIVSKKSITAELSSEEEYVVVDTPSSSSYPRLEVDHLIGKKIPLQRIVCRSPSKKARIPNVIHYVWFGKWEIKRLHYLSIRSAAVIQRPEKIVLHLDDAPPTGIYWEKLRDEIPCLEIVHAIRPKYIFGRLIRDIEHKSDAERMRILIEEGGIYADVNLLFVQPLDRLLNKSFVIGKEDDRTYGNAIMLAEPHAPFMELWFRTYYTFDFGKWAEHSTEMPKRLHEAYPELPIHVEKYSIMRPNYDDDFAWISELNWDLRHNYCVHIYVHDEFVSQWLPDVLKLPFSQLISFDNTFGQFVRLALLGTPYLTMDEMDKKILKSHTPLKCSQTSSMNNVPNVLHYMWDGEKIDFDSYLAMRSAVKALQPNQVNIHLLTVADPLHYRYLQMWRETPCLTVSSASDVYNKIKYLPKNIQRFAARLMILESHGGISLSNDTVLLSKPQIVSGPEVILDEDFNFMIAKPHSSTLKEWIEKLLQLDIFDQDEPLVEISNFVSRFLEDKRIKVIKNFISSNPSGFKKAFGGLSLKDIHLPDTTNEKEILTNNSNGYNELLHQIMLL